MTSPAPLSWSEPEEEQLLGAALTEPAFVVTVNDVASKLGLDPATMTAAQRTRIVNALVEAQAVVEAELGRDTLLPRTVTFDGVTPYTLVTTGMLDRLTWPVLEQFYEPVVVTSATARADGLFDLVVQVGIDARTIEPIRTYIRAHAAEEVRLDPASGMGMLAVTSVSAEGQSISYEKRSTTDGAAGALPTLRSLRHWKRMSVYQAPSRVGPPWPYTGSHGRRY